MATISAKFPKLSSMSMVSPLQFACGGDKPASQSETAQAPTTAESKSIAITAIVEHPALDAVRQGTLEALASAGFKEGENLTVNFQSAQGNPATAGQIAKQFVADNPDAIIAIATHLPKRSSMPPQAFPWYSLP